MSGGTITTNGETNPQIVKAETVHIGLGGTFGTATVALQKSVNGNYYPALDSTGTPITYTAAVDDALYFGEGDRLKLVTTGATGGESIDWSISGAIEKKGGK